MSVLKWLVALLIVMIGTIVAVLPLLSNRWQKTGELANYYEPKAPEIETDCEKHYCSWTQPIKPDSSPPQQKLELETNQQIRASQEDYYAISCIPVKFGYSKEDSDRLFPRKTFKGCAKADLNSSIKFDGVTFELNCPEGKQGLYVFGESMHKERQGRLPFLPDYEQYIGPVTVPEDVEFVYATCDAPTKHAQHAAYVAKPRPNVKERVETKMREKAQELGVAQIRPLTVLHIMVDSLSRNHFYRNFPKTIEYINQTAGSEGNLKQNKYHAFDFKINNVMGNNSPPNLLPFLTGKIGFETRMDAIDDFLGPDSLYSLTGEMGFVTFIATEFCHRYFSWYMGETVNVDHIAASFWCAAKKFSGYWDIAQTERCIGQKPSQKYLLDYTTQHLANYKGYNKWSLVDFLTAHEDSGTVIQTLDDDLLAFLKEFFEGSEQDDFVVYIESDHGMRYGDWFRLIDGAMEHKLPAMVMLASDGILSRIPGARETLRHNTDRLISKFDWRTLDRYLSHVPYTTKNVQSFIEETMSSGNAVNPMLEKIPNTRTCTDINIPGWFCSCKEWVKIGNPEDLRVLATEGVTEINRTLRTSRFSRGRVCQTLSIDEILSAEEQPLHDKASNFKLLLTVHQSPVARFEIAFQVTWTRLEYRNPDKGFGTSPIHIKGRKAWVMVVHVRRMDTFAGVCQDIATAYKVNPEYCVCNDLGYVFGVMPAGTEEALQRNNFRTVGAPGQTCTESCTQKGGHCTDNLSMQLYNVCDESCAGCTTSNEPFAPFVRKSACYLQTVVDPKLSPGQSKRLCDLTGGGEA